MTYKVKNIIIGAAAVYLSAEDSTEWTNAPSLPTVSGTNSIVPGLDGSDDWRHTGFTSEGVEVSYEPDYGEVEVDQLLDSAKLFKQSMRVMVNTTFSEATLENLLVVWGQQNNTYTTGATEETLAIAAGSLGDEPTERSVAFVGPAPRADAGTKRERIYHVRRALSIEASSHSLRRNEATVFPVSFRLLPDPSFSGQEYGVIRDRNIA
ncbi:major tail protein [Streptomyces phage Wofford]|uniref:Major tail protein n=1 Tax=Streptomyces phage Wofford TaxID=2283267 RepID=A0A345M9T2_9CAUD|nr:protein with Ig domain [Streptomyces phage Wollford]AXH67253.1 major tail protein [Streptomyces phage Wollford]